MGYLHLLYRSRAKHEEFHPSDLDILRVALAFNSANGITGLLVRVDEQFLQALHGPAEVVEALYARIAADPRHSAVQTLLREPATQLSPYGEWAMAYDSLIGFENALGMTPEGTYPELAPEKVQSIVSQMTDLARGVSEFGSAFPYSRMSGESNQAYMCRLDGLM